MLNAIVIFALSFFVGHVLRDVIESRLSQQERDSSHLKLQPFNPKRFLLVAEHEYSYLFRSGSLLTHNYKSIDIKSIENAIIKVLPSYVSGIPIIDVCLLESFVRADKVSIKVEREFFEKWFRNYDVLGQRIRPSDIENITERRKFINNFSKWSTLPGIIRELNDILGYDFRKIVIVHCMQGVDRTGEVIGAWLMRRLWEQNPHSNLDQFLVDFVQNDTRLSGHPSPNEEHYNSLLWYKEYLNFMSGR